MSKVKTKNTTKIKKIAEFGHNTVDMISETSWEQFASEMAESPYFEPERTERRNSLRKYAAIAVGGLAVSAAFVGRRKLATGLAIWSATQVAVMPIEKKISEAYKPSMDDESISR